MAVLEMGAEPLPLIVTLVENADFVCTIELYDPDDEEAAVDLDDHEFYLVFEDLSDYAGDKTNGAPATVAWNIPWETGLEDIEDKRIGVYLKVVTGGVNFVWAKGEAVVQ